MKYNYKLLYLLIMAVLFTTCKNEPIMFDNSKAFVAFVSSSASINENSNEGDIPVMLSAVEGSPAATVDYEVVTDGIANPAMEGTDFTIVSPSSLDFPQGSGYAYITVHPINNGDLTGNKSFKLVLTSNSRNYANGAESIITVEIKDDEHPLFNWIGNYVVTAESYHDGHIENWYVTTEADPKDYNYLIINGISSDSANAIKARIDLDQKLITITPGQSLGDIFTDSDNKPIGIGVYKGTDAGDYVVKDEPLIGIIQNDGTIRIDLFGELVISGTYKNYLWDVYNTTWAKQ